MAYHPSETPNEDDEPRLQTRPATNDHPAHVATLYPAEPRPAQPRTLRLLRAAAVLFAVFVVVFAAGLLYARHWVRGAVHDSLPQLDGTLHLPGLVAPVTVQRDPHGTPYLHARTLDDLVFAQGYITAGDRLFQMDTLRRHAGGTLAEILGSATLPHDRLQRTLQLTPAADRALAQLPPDQLHLLEQYARGVNARIAAGDLPIEFRVLRYSPAPWTPRDSLLITLVMFQDLTTQYPTKLAREALTARLSPGLANDLYPVGSWRDHTPDQPIPDLTIPGPPVEQVPLDESQARNMAPPLAPVAKSRPVSLSVPPRTVSRTITQTTILASLAPLLHPTPRDLTPGSNAWAVSGAHTATGKPLLANDMHLSLTVPGLWYTADLRADESNYHAAGVTIPGTPLVCVGHNDHIAWGFTNLGADVQDVYIETTRDDKFLATDNTWQPIVHHPETIVVARAPNQTIDIRLTRHGDVLTPILPSASGDPRTLALRWTAYDPAAVTYPWLSINQAHDWPSFLAALAHWGGPAQNALYADDAGHIGYHAVGLIPLRGAPATPVADPSTLPADLLAPDNPAAHATATDDSALRRIPQSTPGLPTDLLAPQTPTTPLLSGPLSPVPLIPSAAREWSGYIPFDKLPQAFDPPAGILATANARVTPDDYPYPVTLNWAAPYRVERITRQLAHTHGLTAADMLALQNDVYSDFDHSLAQRLAYALDHTATNRNPQAADLLRSWNGRMTTDAPTPAIVSAVHQILWPLLLAPHLQSGAPATGSHPAGAFPSPADLDRIQALYTWGEKDYALEQILLHTPARWLPPGYATWDDFLAAALAEALREVHAPADLKKLTYGQLHTVDLESPIWDRSEFLRRLLGRPTGTGVRPQSGDATTIKQVGSAAHPFGPSERFTADLANPNASTLNLPMGQSENPASPWFQDQFAAWLRGSTYPFPFNLPNPTHTLTLTP